MRRLLRHLGLVTATWLVVAIPAAGDERAALVIGNGSYAHAPVMRTSVNDAKLIAATLRTIGFTVVLEYYDADLATMLSALDAFGTRAQGADYVAIYYAGYGLQVFGTPYLAPIDIQLTDVANMPRQTVTLAQLLAKPAQPQKLRLVILDMPRTNPFGASAWPRGSQREPAREGNLFIAYSTQLGNGLSESMDSNGPFGLALARHLVAPGASIDEVFQHVRRDVMQATNNRQVVWVEATLPSNHQLLPVPAKP